MLIHNQVLNTLRPFFVDTRKLFAYQAYHDCDGDWILFYSITKGILKTYKSITYKYKCVQTLLPGDPERRMFFTVNILTIVNKIPVLTEIVFEGTSQIFQIMDCLTEKNYWSSGIPVRPHAETP